MKKALTITAALTIALTISGCSEKKTAEQYLVEAQKYSQNNEFNSAIIELKNALRVAPKNADARFELGKAYLQQGDYINAEKELERAEQLGVEFTELVVSLIEVKTKLNKSEDVYQLVKKSGDLADDDYVLVLTFAGIAAIQNGDKALGQDFFNQAVSISEAAYFSQVSKAYLARLDKEYLIALDGVESLLSASNEVVPETLLLKGLLLTTLKRNAEAAKVFEQYTQLRPKDAYVHFFQANSLIKAEELDLAEKKVDNLLKQYKDSPLALQYKAQIEYLRGNFKESKRFAEQSMSSGEASIFAKLIGGSSAFQLQENELAYRLLKSIEPYMPPSHPGKRMIAILQMRLGYVSEAADAIYALDGSNEGDYQLMTSSSFELSKLNQFDKAEKLIDKAEQNKPTNANILVQKGVMLLNQNDESGLEFLEKSLALDENMGEVEQLLALQYLRSGDDKKAEEIALKAINSEADKARGYLLQGIIFSKQMAFEKAKESFKQVLLLDENNVSALFNLGKLEARTENKKEAINYYQQALNISPGHSGSLEQLVTLNLQLNTPELAIDFLSNLLNSNTNSINTRMALANVHLITGQAQQAITVLENNPEQQSLPAIHWLLLGDSHYKLGDVTKSQEAYQAGVNKQPQSYMLHLRLVGATGGNKNYLSAINQAKNALLIFADDARLQMLLANYELLAGNIGEAKALTKILKAKNVDQPLLTSVEADIAMQEKQYQKASEHYAKLYNVAPTDATAINLARSLKFNGGHDKAEKALENHLPVAADKPNVTILLISLYGNNQPEKVITLYQELLKTAPDNATLLNNLAWAQYQINQAEKALTSIEKAYEIDANNLSIIESYGVILVANGQYEKAVKVLEDAIAQGSKDQDVSNKLTQAKAKLSS